MESSGSLDRVQFDDHLFRNRRLDSVRRGADNLRLLENMARTHWRENQPHRTAKKVTFLSSAAPDRLADKNGTLGDSQTLIHVGGQKQGTVATKHRQVSQYSDFRVKFEDRNTKRGKRKGKVASESERLEHVENDYSNSGGTLVPVVPRGMRHSKGTVTMATQPQQRPRALVASLHLDMQSFRRTSFPQASTQTLTTTVKTDTVTARSKNNLLAASVNLPPLQLPHLRRRQNKTDTQFTCNNGFVTLTNRPGQQRPLNISSIPDMEGLTEDLCDPLHRGDRETSAMMRRENTRVLLRRVDHILDPNRLQLSSTAGSTTLEVHGRSGSPTMSSQDVGHRREYVLKKLQIDLEDVKNVNSKDDAILPRRRLDVHTKCQQWIDSIS
uniref:Uncharacterized protein n=1 Tax=Branchiostoma floridae TaxID=7739 RepID=C3XXI1_BRAFL|eukprot:XP_002611431.1 hypothetical protein BRAFLDRAFT_63937 [Branchiostoma floridae]